MLTSLTGSSPDSSPTRMPARQKGSVTIPRLPSLTLPPLPPITNPAIRRMALTHSSSHSGDKRRNRELITDEAEAALDYEKLEHVGDGLLGAQPLSRYSGPHAVSDADAGADGAGADEIS